MSYGQEGTDPVTLQIYSTCPQSKDVPADRYAAAVAETARWSEAAGCTGMLVYTDNGIADPWLVAQTVLTATAAARAAGGRAAGVHAPVHRGVDGVVAGATCTAARCT